MIAQVVTLQIQPDKLDIFLAEIMSNVRASREEPGVAQFELLQQADDAFRFMLYEVYLDENALEAHRQTTHFKHWVEFGVPLLAGERKRTIYKLVE
jgi:(4S)-4-hydroxy-5-phosphonooxypentane-2,3-dione isomerase